MILDTERMGLMLLTPPQLKLLAENLAVLEPEINCAYRGEPVEGFFLSIIRSQYEKAAKDPEQLVWHSFFLLVRKEDRVVVGSADFKHPPKADGTVEIGYGLGKAFEHNGYMTEAIRAMCAWAKQQPEVTAVIAETEPENTASQRVLARCGFRQYKQEENLWWIL